MGPTDIRHYRYMTGVSCAVLFVVTTFYVVQWLSLPLYPDEISLRLHKMRYFADGFVSYGLIPCHVADRFVPIVFRPAAYVLSVVDLSLGWSFIRIIPIGGIVLVFGAVVAFAAKKGAPQDILILALGTIGVAGSGLLLLRYEVPMLFLGGVCLLGFLYFDRARSPIAVTIYLMVLASVAITALYIHQQAAIFVIPLALLAIAISLRQKSFVIYGVAAAAIAVVVYAGALSINEPSSNCAQSEAVGRKLDLMTLSGLARHSGKEAVMEYLQGKLPAYAGQFLFQTAYEVNYLPAVDLDMTSEPLLTLNWAIWLAVLANVLGAFLVMIGAIVRSAGLLVTRVRGFGDVLPWLSRPESIIATTIGGHLLLLIYSAQAAFYRDFYIHLALVVMNTLVISGWIRRFRSVRWIVGVVAVTISIGSATVASSTMREKFEAGWIGPSVSLSTDWAALWSDVQNLKKQCDIKPDQAGIVIDDTTYDALKLSRHLMAITYIGFSHPEGFGAGRIKLILGDLSATAVVAQCSMFEASKMASLARSGNICCASL